MFKSSFECAKSFIPREGCTCSEKRDVHVAKDLDTSLNDPD